MFTVRNMFLVWREGDVQHKRGCLRFGKGLLDGRIQTGYCQYIWFCRHLQIAMVGPFRIGPFRSDGWKNIIKTKISLQDGLADT